MIVVLEFQILKILFSLNTEFWGAPLNSALERAISLGLALPLALLEIQHLSQAPSESDAAGLGAMF